MIVLDADSLMTGDAIDEDMGELVDKPVAVKVAIVGFEQSDHVIEIIEYPNQPPSTDHAGELDLTAVGPSHIGLLCDDVEAERARLAEAGVEVLVSGIASIARLRTIWFRDPWGIVFILLEKERTGRAYWNQF